VDFKPFVVPIAINSLLAQSKDQHDVSSSSMRNAGSDNLTENHVKVMVPPMGECMQTKYR